MIDEEKLHKSSNRSQLKQLKFVVYNNNIQSRIVSESCGRCSMVLIHLNQDT